MESILVSRDISWLGPKCCLSGPSLGAEYVHLALVLFLGHHHSLAFLFLMLDWSWREHHWAEV